MSNFVKSWLYNLPSQEVDCHLTHALLQDASIKVSLWGQRLVEFKVPQENGPFKKETAPLNLVAEKLSIVVLNILKNPTFSERQGCIQLIKCLEEYYKEGNNQLNQANFFIKCMAKVQQIFENRWYSDRHIVGQNYGRTPQEVLTYIRYCCSTYTVQQFHEDFGQDHFTTCNDMFCQSNGYFKLKEELQRLLVWPYKQNLLGKQACEFPASLYVRESVITGVE